MISWLMLKLGAPKWAIIAGAVSLLILAAGVGKCAYDKRVIERHAAEQKAKQAKRERQADANLERQKDADDAAAVARQVEIDNATRNIPDQAPSDRQRARVCVELVRQAKAAGQPAPAC